MCPHAFQRRTLCEIDRERAFRAPFAELVEVVARNGTDA